MKKKKLVQIILGCVLILGSVNIAYPCYGSSYYEYEVQLSYCSISFRDECPECAGWLDNYATEAHCCRHLRGFTQLFTPPYEQVVGWSEYCDLGCQVPGIGEAPNPFPLHPVT